ncbi:Hypothetical protein NTJ_04647 [Nesidiocoris tenuis]|uniref:Uncharacterized protein n=1 Tax=Nesidiocoris tenuis TaxID=355587 RepID=A0ABN7AIR0_9HEMI|nr:Hypothetical protein NTJ_04647 [Nesidiocoris tenuis]
MGSSCPTHHMSPYIARWPLKTRRTTPVDVGIVNLPRKSARSAKKPFKSDAALAHNGKIPFHKVLSFSRDGFQKCQEIEMRLREGI